jgi:hypothetical protein
VPPRCSRIEGQYEAPSMLSADLRLAGGPASEGLALVRPTARKLSQ